jgi:hypothetical protein
MPTTVMIVDPCLYRQEPPCPMGLECDARGTNCGSGALPEIKAVDMPEQRFFEGPGQGFVFDNAATNLTSSLR